ncbi:MAG: tRNA preQ1(34) S-adenosylmethionine ribosyltransferase-isomerase QueA [Rickettsiales bacterium]|nr:tRNA preQ1(34) S-adenosylmethionine ribosyltransferase-isomerase QueA [Rickettsiales bacterium]|tara:strand:+ start:1001 stop:2041 length:1041 start_codon:yes stop_codon:yes gene_type:complete
MKTSDFDFYLPEMCIADAPCEPRDACKLLQVSKFFFDFSFLQFPELLNPGDVVVFNNSKVIPARLFGTKGDAKIELLLHKKLTIESGQLWRCFAKPGKKLKEGDTVSIANNFVGEIVTKCASGEVEVLFNYSAELFDTLLHTHGHMPLPPYIKREDQAADAQDYQTVYAAHPGSVAAPTAGLHFSDRILEQLDARGIHRAEVTLHVGGGTFLPVKSERVEDHVMHSEWYQIDADQAEIINRARANKGRVIAVGTTALRVLESVAATDGMLKAAAGETDIFITPGYQFKVVDRLLTNFHLPKSTLFMLVCAFSGLDRMQAAYDYAMEEGYRFYSYGDACLLDRMAIR